MTKDSAEYILSLRPKDDPCHNCEHLTWYCPPNGYIKYWTCFIMDSCQYMKDKQKEGKRMKNYDVLNGLVPKTEELHRAIFDKGYEQGLNDGSSDINTFVEAAYEKGLNDAWECARKISNMDFKTRKEALSVNSYHDSLGEIVNNFSPSEAIAKIKEYEEKQKQSDDEIKVGDEVYLSSLSKSYPRIVLSLYGENDGLGLKARTMLSSGTIDIKPVSEFKKTGRHFDQIAEVLKQLKEEN